jgi:hypothetical protein
VETLCRLKSIKQEYNSTDPLKQAHIFANALETPHVIHRSLLTAMLHNSLQKKKCLTSDPLEEVRLFINVLKKKFPNPKENLTITYNPQKST